MAETPQDVVNRELREFKRYTGDGLPGEPVNAPLPVGDPQSGVHNPKKADLRAALLGVLEANSSIIEVIPSGGTANAQQADIGENSNVDNALVYFMRVATDNTGPMTLSIAGETARYVVNAAGNPLSAGEWTGVVLFVLNDDGDYQLIIDAGAAASAAQSAGHAKEWAQSEEPISISAGGDGASDRSAKWWAELAGQTTLPDGSIVFAKLSSTSLASQFEAEAGTAANKLMTPERTAQAIAELSPATAPVPQGRLSLVPATPAPEADSTGATTIHYVPCNGELVPIYDGAKLTSIAIGSGISLVLDNDSSHTGYHQSGSIYDLFVFLDGANLRLGTGVSWGAGASAGSNDIGDSYRGTGAGSTELEAHLGILVNKNEIAIRWGSLSGEVTSVSPRMATYIGSFVATADGQATDSKSKRLLFNAYNRTARPMRFVYDPLGGYTYTSTSWRQSGGLSSYQLEFLLGLAGISVCAENDQSVAPTESVNIVVALGLNSASVPSADCSQGYSAIGDGGVGDVRSRYRGFPGLGWHALKAMEKGGNGAIFYNGEAGMSGEFLG